MSMFAFGNFSMMGPIGGMSGMMGNMYGGMGMSMMMGFAPVLAAVGLMSGSVVVLGSAMLFARPSQTQVWGAVILAFSLVSIIGFAGLIVGLVLGVLGGVLALTWSPSQKPVRPSIP